MLTIALVTCVKMVVHVLMVSTHIAADALLISRETIVNLMLTNVPRGKNSNYYVGKVAQFIFADRQCVKMEQRAQTLTEVMRAFA